MYHLYKKVLLIFSLLALLSSYCFAQSPSSSGYVPVKQGKLYYERYGSGTPILVIHGGPGGALGQNYLKPQLLALAEKNEVIFYDQRGSGKSLETDMDRSVINLKQFTDDIEALRSALNIDKCILLGHSWGGMLAMNYAIQHPDHIAKLILVDSMPANLSGKLAAAVALNTLLLPIYNEISDLDNYDKLQTLSVEQIISLNRKMFSVSFYNPLNVEKLSLDMTIESALSGYKVNEMMMQDMFDNLIPPLQKLNVPTTVIHGEHDFIPIWTAEEIARAIPNAKLVIIPESSHFPFIENPDAFFSAVG